MNDPTRVAVVGATGYAGFELAQLLLRHPKIQKPTFYLRESSVAREVPDRIFPAAARLGRSAVQDAFRSMRSRRAERALCFFPRRMKHRLELVPQLRRNSGCACGSERRVPLPRSRNVRALVQDCRRRRGNCWRRAVYGLPELYADQLPDARLVANPGCYPTSVILGLRPLVESGWIARERGIVCDCKSGATGAGKEPKRELHFVEVDENFRAYGLFSHRHTPEVTDHTGIAAEDIVFTTHLLPVARGILSTLYVWLAEPHTAEEVEALYRKFYADRPMVRILAGRQAAGTAARGAHEFLRHRICARSRGRRLVGRELSRQSGQRRRGPGGTEHERDAGLSRRRQD